MIGPGVGSGMDSARVPHSVQAGEGKSRINVGRMTVKAEKNVTPDTPEAAAAKQTAEMKKAAEELTIKLVEEAKDALAKSGVEARNALKLVSGNEAIVNNLWGQRDAEYLEASMIKDPKEQTRRCSEIQKRYEKLTQYAENRQNKSRLEILRLKQSENPSNKALAIDLENANAQLDIRSYNMIIGRIQIILQSGLDPRTNLPLEKSVRDHYSSKLHSVNVRRDLLEKNTLESKRTRDNMRDVDGKPIRNVIDDMATVLGGGKQENPMAFLELHVSQALASESGMDKFANKLVEIKVLNADDKKKFIEDMTLGLTWQERADMYKKTGGSILMTLMSLGGLLAYVAAQKTLREGGGQ